MFGCNNDRLFPKKYIVKGHISNTKLEKGDHFTIVVKRSIAYQQMKDVINIHQANVNILRGQFSKHVNHGLDT